MSKKSSQENDPRIPYEFKGIQVNCCKFTRCENFGLTPEKVKDTDLYREYNKNKAGRQVRENDPFYMIVGSRDKMSSIKCRSCEAINATSKVSNQAHYVLKSNRAVHEELERISSYLVKPGTKCNNPACLSHKEQKYHIKKRGKTTKGTPRFFCNDCETSFTGKAIQRPHEKPELNKMFFKHLVGKSPLRQIKFILEMNMGMIYRRLNFIHNQCVAFVADRERKLFEVKSYKRLYLCTDRQIQKSNWTNRKEKSNCEFYGIGTADLISGYVLAFNFNYDPLMNPKEIEDEAMALQEGNKLRHNRKFARVWLKSDFEQSKNAKNNKKSSVSAEYSVQTKTNNENNMSSESFDKTSSVPVKGMEVHNEYTMVAHFFLIKKLTKNVDKTRFYLDLDIGMKTWYLAAFKEEVSKGNSDGFLVTLEKDMTVDNRRHCLHEAQLEISRYCGNSDSSLSHKERKKVINNMIIENIEAPITYPKSIDAWVENPTPSISEPNKMVSSFTNIDRYDLEHQANLYRKGSLHAIDRFFMQIRRRVNMFERPLHSASNQGRTWNGYGPYNPEMYQKLADIFRVFYNYCQISDKSKDTPAMRLGLAKGVVDLEKIIYFEKYNK